jgi:hypothetical protein
VSLSYYGTNGQGELKERGGREEPDVTNFDEIITQKLSSN